MAGATAFSCTEFTLDSFYDALKNAEFIRPKSDPKLDRLVRFILAHGAPVTQVVEEGYVDRDFVSDHVNYYATCFKAYPKNCRRLHFFRGDPATVQASLQRILQEGLPVLPADEKRVLDDLNGRYLGFAVIKPLPDKVLGRTALLPPPGSTTPCVRRFDGHFGGIPLWVDSLPWQEQDQVVSACATSALWSAFQLTAHRFGYYVPTPYEITKRATDVGTEGRPIPSEGLTIEQMSRATRAIGLEAELKEYKRIEGGKRMPRLPLLAYSYSYLRAGIPVVLAVEIEGRGRHAVTLCGYELGNTPLIANELDATGVAKTEMQLTGSRIRAFIGHDDQIQPFAKMSVLYKRDAITLETAWDLDGGAAALGATRLADVTPLAAVVPLYHKIRISVLPLLPHVEELHRFLQNLKAFDGHYSALEYDTYLVGVNEYKEEMLRSRQILARERALLTPMPRFVWRLQAKTSKGPVFDLLGDATDMEKSFQFIGMNLFDRQFAESVRAAWIANDKLAMSLIPLMRKLVWESLSAALKA